MHLKIPPPVIGLLAAIAIWTSNRFFPELRVSVPFLPSLGLLIGVLGLFIDLISVAYFYRAKTTVNPLSPHKSRFLVDSGFYRFSRNPMYLGMLFILTGYVLWLGQPVGLLWIVLFVWYITQFQIKPEEKILLEKFKAEYADYQHRVRRWL